jgi:hypothetical protein
MWRDPLDELIDELEQAMPTPASSWKAQEKEMRAAWYADMDRMAQFMWSRRGGGPQPITPSPIEAPTVPASSMSEEERPVTGRSADAMTRLSERGDK